MGTSTPDLPHAGAIVWGAGWVWCDADAGSRDEPLSAQSARPPTFARQAVGGAAWAYLGFALAKLLSFATTVVLARLLAIDDFGLVGYAFIVVSYFEVVRDLGLSAALIAYPSGGDEQRVRSTAFLLTVALGTTLAGCVVGLAPIAGQLVGHPDMVEMTRVLALNLLLSGLARTHDALLQKELGFGRRLAPELGQALVKGGVSIALALIGFGAWSMVWGQVAGTIVGTILTWMVFPWLPRPAFDPHAARHLLGFGGQLATVNLVAAALLNSDYLLVGQLLGIESLGLYTLAFRLPDMLLITLCWVLSRVLFPIFARLRDDETALRRFYLQVFRFVALGAIPLGLGLLATGPSLVLVLFGEKWTPIVPTLRLLAIYSTLHALYFHAGDVFKALGQGGLLVRFSLLSALVVIPSMLTGLTWLGLPGVALGWIVGDSVRLILSQRALRRLLGVRIAELAEQLRPALLAGLAMLATTWPLGQALGEPGWPVLVAQVTTGAAVYAALAVRLDRRLLADLRALVAKVPLSG